jgi:hypothetical protein
VMAILVTPVVPSQSSSGALVVLRVSGGRRSGPIPRRGPAGLGRSSRASRRAQRGYWRSWPPGVRGLRGRHARCARRRPWRGGRDTPSFRCPCQGASRPTGWPCRRRTCSAGGKRSQADRALSAHSGDPVGAMRSQNRQGGAQPGALAQPDAGGRHKSADPQLQRGADDRRV